MSDAQEIDYDYLGHVSARGWFANSSITLVEMGIHLFMAIYGLSVYLETPKHLRKGRFPYIAVSFVITILTALSGSLDAVWIFQHLFQATSGESFYDALLEDDDSSWGRVLSLAAFTAVIIIGDALLVYRCYVMWSHRWWLSVLPGLSYFASVGLGIFLVIPDPNVSSDAYASIESAWVFLSVLTNVMVTALISFQLLSMRRMMLKLLPSASSDLNLYTGVVAILIESALPLSLFGLIYASIVVATPKRSTGAYASYLSAFYTFSCLFYAFSALSPHMIIFRITTGRSWMKAPQRPASGELSTPIEFNHPPFEQSLVQTTVTGLVTPSSKENASSQV